MSIIFGSLFSGVGGLDLGLEWAGMKCIWHVEIDDYFQRVLVKHRPDVSKYRDVRDVGQHNLETVDLIAGGFPCQPHSVAGKRRGAADDRNLWPEFSRIIAELRPRYVLGENVPNIKNTYLDTVLSDLESRGYTCGTFNIPAVAFDAPHRRERIFIVAYDQSRGEGRLSIRSRGSLETEAYVIGSGQDVSECSWWTVEPDVGRVAHGIPSRVHRLRGLGNAVVPQVAEWIGRRILEFDAYDKST